MSRHCFYGLSCFKCWNWFKCLSRAFLYKWAMPAGCGNYSQKIYIYSSLCPLTPAYVGGYLYKNSWGYFRVLQNWDVQNFIKLLKKKIMKNDDKNQKWSGKQAWNNLYKPSTTAVTTAFLPSFIITDIAKNRKEPFHQSNHPFGFTHLMTWYYGLSLLKNYAVILSPSLHKELHLEHRREDLLQRG